MNWHQLINGPPGAVNLPKFADGGTTVTTDFLTLPNWIFFGEHDGPREVMNVNDSELWKRRKLRHLRSLRRSGFHLVRSELYLNTWFLRMTCGHTNFCRGG